MEFIGKWCEKAGFGVLFIFFYWDKLKWRYDIHPANSRMPGWSANFSGGENDKGNCGQGGMTSNGLEEELPVSIISSAPQSEDGGADSQIQLPKPDISFMPIPLARQKLFASKGEVEVFPGKPHPSTLQLAQDRAGSGHGHGGDNPSILRFILIHSRS